MQVLKREHSKKHGKTINKATSSANNHYQSWRSLEELTIKLNLRTDCPPGNWLTWFFRTQILIPKQVKHKSLVIGSLSENIRRVMTVCKESYYSINFLSLFFFSFFSINHINSTIESFFISDKQFYQYFFANFLSLSSTITHLIFNSTLIISNFSFFLFYFLNFTLYMFI